MLETNYLRIIKSLSFIIKFKQYHKHNSPSKVVFQYFDSQTGIDDSNTFM